MSEKNNKNVVVNAALAKDDGKKLLVTNPKKLRVSKNKEVAKENKGIIR
ncbi:MAG: hypothetical protein IJ809_05730 [Clostridia bacterium]|nr:hypothetical protein [Clostridia bacterium]